MRTSLSRFATIAIFFLGAVTVCTTAQAGKRDIRDEVETPVVLAQGSAGGSTPTPSEPEVQPAEQFHYMVGLDPQGDNWLALRSEPSGTRGRRLMKMGPATLLTVLGQKGKWLQVRLTTGEVGWAHGDYVACCRAGP